MYDILLINPINHYGLSSNPLGMQIIHSICEKNGYKVKLLDLALEHKKEGYFFTKELFTWIENKIKLYPSKYYGISIMNGTFIWGLEIAKIIKKLDYKKIVFVGGPQATALKEKIFDITTNIDYCLLYEGETTVLKFLNMIEDEKAQLPYNVIKRDEMDYTCQLTSENINEIPPLDYKDYYNVRIVDVEVGRGCPYSCYYCSAKSLVGHNIRYKKIEKILSESQELYDNMCAETRKYINFNHDNFLSSRKVFKEFINKKLGGKYGFPYGCEGRIDAIDDEIIDDLYKSNCVYLFVGLETGSERMQEISKKRLHLNDIKSKIKKITDKGIFFESNFIIGFPEETLEDLYQTIRLVAELSWISFNVRISYSFMSPEPGSEVFHNVNLDECVMVKDDHIYSELKSVGFDVDNMPVLYFNHLYTIQNLNYDVLYKMCFYIFSNVI